MKIFYTILLTIGLLFVKGDAQSDAGKISQKDSVITLHPDSSNLVRLDSLSDVTASVDTKSIADSIASIKSENVLFGIASFYSRNLEGTETSTGETFTHNKLTAASNFFKLNTWVRVTNLRNGKSVIVRINDRMHKSMSKKGRVVDLSIMGAKKIGLNSYIGITKVKIEEVPPNTEE